MSTLEERVQALEQEHAELKTTNAELKEKIELQTIALSGLVNKTILEQINNKNDKTFKALIKHDELTNRQLAEFRTDLSELHTKVDDVDGKIVGMQTEVRQRFVEQDSKITGLQTDVSDLKSIAQQILARLPKEPSHGDEIV